MPSGWTNDCENVIYEEDIGHSYTKTKPEVLHAETNALAKVARSTNSSDGASLFVTHAPCLECAKLMKFCLSKRSFKFFRMKIINSGSLFWGSLMIRKENSCLDCSQQHKNKNKSFNMKRINLQWKNRN